MRDHRHVDFGLARRWLQLQLCTDQHGKKCSHPAHFDLDPTTNLRVTDVQNRIVFSAPDAEEYVALKLRLGMAATCRHCWRSGDSALETPSTRAIPENCGPRDACDLQARLALPLG
jgi:hypothetical protein